MAPPEVTVFVEAARTYVRRSLGVELDGSEESLAFLDHYVERTRAEGPLAPEVLALVAPAIGAYFGEVAIAKFGGAWQLGADRAQAATWRIDLEPAELRFAPIGMAAAALAQEDVAGYDASFSTGPAFRGPLEEALASSAPVDEAYFYSLTGRLETLALVLDILIDLKEKLKRITS